MTFLRFRAAALVASVVVGSSFVDLAELGAQPPAPQGAERGARPDGTPRGERLERGGPGRAGQRGMARQGAGRALFRGITLDSAQRARVRQIHQAHATERRTAMQEARADWQRPADGARPDSAARLQRQAGREALRTRLRTVMEQEVTALRAVLTAPQQATFDRNLAEVRERATTREARKGEGRHMRPGRGDGAPRGSQRGR